MTLPAGEAALPFRSLGEIGTFKKGGGISRNQVSAIGLPAIRYGEIYTQYDDRIVSVETFVSRTVAESAERVAKGDILFAASGETALEIGKCAVYLLDDPGYAGGDIVVFRPRTGNPLFLAYALNAPAAIEQKARLGQGDAVVHISASNLATVTVPFPPKNEQDAIAQAMSDVDDLIASLDVLIAKKHDIMHGAGQQLLTGNRRLPGFSREWATVELGSLCTMKSGIGITSRKISDAGLFPVFGANGLRGFTGSKTHSGVFPLIGRVGALCGNIQVARGDFFASEHAIVAEPKGLTDPEWLALALARLELNRLSEASAQPVLTVGKLARVLVYAPSDSMEQRAISQTILSMHDELEQLHARLGKLREIRQGMMQQLLTGRVRLN